jgi:TAG lipase / lysophosphatidylethanolamine acyltransferase
VLGTHMQLQRVKPQYVLLGPDLNWWAWSSILLRLQLLYVHGMLENDIEHPRNHRQGEEVREPLKLPQSSGWITAMSIVSWLAITLYSILDFLRFIPWAGASSSIEYLELAATRSKTYEEWLTCQTELNSIQQKDAWFSEDRDPSYDWKALRGHKSDLVRCREACDNRGLAGQLRTHSSRNICRILSAPLYWQSRVRTKNLIESYLFELSVAIRHLARRESIIVAPHLVSSQELKRQLFYDVKQALGRTTLVMQGGATFSLCHLGVVKALHARGLLPQIITGTATGALISALVCTTPTHELGSRLSGESIDLSAFERSQLRTSNNQKSSGMLSNWSDTISRRIKRLLETGHLFDIEILQECAKDNLGDITFADAYAKTGRILNITVALSDVPGMPQLLNYITAPYVFIWSAVVASIATSKMMYGTVSLFCRDENGNPVRFFASDAVSQPHIFGRSVAQEPPLKRIGELFNVNHFIVSQTRPYIIPFIRIQQYGTGFFGRGVSKIITLGLGEALHWLHAADHHGILPAFLSRLLLDEAMPGGSHWSKMTITPNFQFRDIFRVFEIPTAVNIEEWSQRGERSVWPAVCELRVRCGVEFELDVAHDSVRRLPSGPA